MFGPVHASRAIRPERMKTAGSFFAALAILVHLIIRLPRPLLFGIGAALIAYLCWRLLLPFLPAVCWALALAIIAEPMRAWLSRKSVPPSVTAAIVVVLILAVVAGPGTLLATWNADQLCPGIRVVEAQRTVRMIDGLQLPEMLTWPASARLVGFQRFCSRASLALVLLAAPVVAFGQTDEIQVYDAEIAEPGVFNLMIHTNYVPIGRKTPDFRGAIIADHSVNGAAEWAYGVTDWFEQGLYLPVYRSSRRLGHHGYRMAPSRDGQETGWDLSRSNFAPRA